MFFPKITISVLSTKSSGIRKRPDPSALRT
jgi:hypothetical protein